MNIERFIKLKKEPVTFSFDVQPLHLYELNFFIFSREEETVHNPCLMFVNFDNKVLDDDERKANRISLSPHVGYYRYIETIPEGFVFHKEFIIPKGVYRIKIGIMEWKNQSDIFISKDVSWLRIPVEKLVEQREYFKQKSKSGMLKAVLEVCEKEYKEDIGKLPDTFIVQLEKKYHTHHAELYAHLYHFFLDKSYSQAVLYAKKSLVLHPENTVIRQSLCFLHIEHGSLKKALQVLTKEMSIPYRRIGRERVEKIAKKMSSESIEKSIAYLLEHFPKDEENLLPFIFSVLKDIYPEIAIEYGLKHLISHPDDLRFNRVLIKRMIRFEMYEKVISSLKLVRMYTDDYDIDVALSQAEIQQAVRRCEVYYDEGKREEAEKIISEIEEKFGNHGKILYSVLYRFYRERSYEKASFYMQKALSFGEDEALFKEYYDLHLRYGHIRKALSVLPQNYTLEAIGIKQRTGSALHKLLEHGAHIKLPDIHSDYHAQKGKVLYLLHNRLPYNSGGYATRTHGLLTNIAKKGWDIHGVSRLGYPDDKIKGIVSKEVDVIDGIFYHRLQNEDQALGSMPMTAYLQAYAEALFAFAQKERPAFIHAASNHMNGLVGNAVAKALGIPSVYEVRGLWEITRISREPAWKDTDYYKLMVRLEAQAAKEADVVLTLTEALKNEMISRGVEEGKIYIVPNGVTSMRFMPRKRDRELEKKLGVKGKCVVGYIGSVVAYEGLELLVDAVALLSERNIRPFVVLIVGDGAVLDKIKQRVTQKKVEAYFIFTGRVPHEEVERYYSLVDITPFPRRAQPVCEMVSPLKPFEAMAMEKAVLSSNVAALAEIVRDGYNGLLFEKESVEDLAKKLALLIEDRNLRKKLGKKAREWAVEERDWSHIAQKVDHVYRMLEGEEDGGV